MLTKMIHHYWLIVLIVTTISCNVKSRPQNNDEAKNIYPVYRTEGNLSRDRHERYSKFVTQNKLQESVVTIKTQFKKIIRKRRETRFIRRNKVEKKKGDTEFVRIDQKNDKVPSSDKTIVIKNIEEVRNDFTLVEHFLSNTLGDLKVPQKTIRGNVTIDRVDANVSNADFVPISSSNKKKWPGDPNGVQSLDDLIMYHTYTSNTPKPNVDNDDDDDVKYQDYPYVTQNKPSIIIIEELTTRPYYDYNSYYTNRPTRPPYYETTVRPTSHPIYITNNEEYVNPITPPNVIINIQTPTVLPEVETTTTYYRPSTVYYTTTKKPKKPRPSKKPSCPNIIITSSNTVTNTNSIKEGCENININIQTSVENLNNATQSTPNQPVILQSPQLTQGPPTVQQPIQIPAGPIIVSNNPIQAGIVTVLGSFISALGAAPWNIFALPFWSRVFAPLTVILAGGIGIAALMFPFAFPHFWFRRLFRGRNRNRNRVIILRNRMDKPQKFVYGEINDNSKYLKRTVRDVSRLPFRGYVDRKIERSVYKKKISKKLGNVDNVDIGRKFKKRNRSTRKYSDKARVKTNIFHDKDRNSITVINKIYQINQIQTIMNNFNIELFFDWWWLKDNT